MTVDNGRSHPYHRKIAFRKTQNVSAAKRSEVHSAREADAPGGSGGMTGKQKCRRWSVTDPQGERVICKLLSLRHRGLGPRAWTDWKDEASAAWGSQRKTRE